MGQQHRGLSSLLVLYLRQSVSHQSVLGVDVPLLHPDASVGCRPDSDNFLHFPKVLAALDLVSERVRHHKAWVAVHSRVTRRPWLVG